MHRLYTPSRSARRCDPPRGPPGAQRSASSSRSQPIKQRDAVSMTTLPVRSRDRSRTARRTSALERSIERSPVHRRRITGGRMSGRRPFTIRESGEGQQHPACTSAEDRGTLVDPAGSIRSLQQGTAARRLYVRRSGSPPFVRGSRKWKVAQCRHRNNAAIRRAASRRRSFHSSSVKRTRGERPGVEEHARRIPFHAAVREALESGATP